MRRLSIKAKMAVAVAGSMGLVALVNAVVALVTYKADMRFEAQEAVRRADRAFAALERREVDKLSATLDALLNVPELTTALAEADRPSLIALATPILRELRERHGISGWSFVGPPPSLTCILRVERPELHGDAVTSSVLEVAGRRGEFASGIEVGPTGFALRVARTVVVQGRVIGFMELAESVEGFLARLKSETGDDYALTVSKALLDRAAWTWALDARRSGWGDDPELAVVDATASGVPPPASSIDIRRIPAGGLFLERTAEGSRRVVRGVVPVADAGGRPAGGLFVLHDVSALRDRLRGDQIRVIVLIALVALAMLGFLVLVLERMVFRRLARMTQAMQDASIRMAGGDYEIGSHPAPSASDELGRFEAFFATFLATIGGTLRDLEKRRRGG